LLRKSAIAISGAGRIDRDGLRKMPERFSAVCPNDLWQALTVASVKTLEKPEYHQCPNDLYSKEF
jgi:hypothetical protein